MQIFLRIHSPIRFLPAIVVMAGAHDRTLLMFFMFQNTRIRHRIIAKKESSPRGITLITISSERSNKCFTSSDGLRW